MKVQESKIEPSRLAFESLSIGRKLAYGYAAAGSALLVVLTLRVPVLEPWFWRALMILVMLIVSLRSALIYAYRKRPSQLSWWIRPSPVERNFAATWLVYAVIFGASSLLFLFI